MMINRKFVLGSVFPVCVSTKSIYFAPCYISQKQKNKKTCSHVPLLFPTRQRKKGKNLENTCALIRSRTLSIKDSGHGKISGAHRSVTHARVRACRSFVSGGRSGEGPRSARMSSMSMIVCVYVGFAFGRTRDHIYMYVEIEYKW